MFGFQGIIIELIAQVILPISLALIMFSMGLSLTLEDFKRVTRFPKAFCVGLFLQMVTLPAMAFLLAMAWARFTPVDPQFLVGLIIIASCPGGVTSNMFAHLAKGDTALSISLTAIISIISVVSVPFLVNMGIHLFLNESGPASLPLGKTVIGVFCITTIPVAIGMLVHKLQPGFTKKFEPMAKKLAAILFVIIVVAAVAKEWVLLSTNFGTVGPMTLLLNLAAMTLAFFVAKSLNLNSAQNKAIVFECGLQNGTLAITVALTFLNNEAMVVPAGLYSILMFITGGVYLYWCQQTR